MKELCIILSKMNYALEAASELHSFSQKSLPDMLLLYLDLIYQFQS